MKTVGFEDSQKMFGFEEKVCSLLCWMVLKVAPIVLYFFLHSNNKACHLLLKLVPIQGVMHQDQALQVVAAGGGNLTDLGRTGFSH